MIAANHPAETTLSSPSVLADMLARGRTLVMGILNVTPDSFSDGGRFIDPLVAAAHARQMAADGADIIDIGAESTRPYVGMQRVTADEELRRLKPVLPAIAALGVPISIDTMKATVADWVAARPRHGASGCRTWRPGNRDAQSRKA
jgi:dihydropteroate synthase